ARSSSGTPWPVIRKKPTLCNAASTSAATPARAACPPLSQGVRSITGTDGCMPGLPCHRRMAVVAQPRHQCARTGGTHDRLDLAAVLVPQVGGAAGREAAVRQPELRGPDQPGREDELPCLATAGAGTGVGPAGAAL